MGPGPSSKAVIRDNPDKIAAFVEEALRISSPVQTLFRRAKEPVTIGDRKPPKLPIIRALWISKKLTRWCWLPRALRFYSCDFRFSFFSAT